MTVLVSLFLATVAIIGARLWLAARERPLVCAFRAAFAQVDSHPALSALAAARGATRHPYGRLARAALEAWRTASHRGTLHRSEWLYRALQTQLEREVAEREWGLTLLATAANTAPYIGLFGTVWSIYHALSAIALSGEASLAAVAGPVGEALIMTAVGLAVAIPAAIAHNLFGRANRLVIPELEAFAHACYLLLAAEDEEPAAATP
nr:MotA/TolQ/ExbB proton channel family protein [Hydrogenophilus thiooxidans]